MTEKTPMLLKFVCFQMPEKGFRREVFHRIQIFEWEITSYLSKN